MRLRYITVCLFIVIMLTSLSACAGAGDVPAQVVERYHQALVEKDQERLLNSSCADWEAMALMELDSFMSVETELVEFACQTTSSDEKNATVTCEGAISATYDGEAREFPLDIQTFLVVQEGGEWRLCGYE
jgi:hypothetical protein